MAQEFRQIRNDERELEAFADGYKQIIGHELWLVEGLQKDAIQNSWDARINEKHAKGWECRFDLSTVAGKTVLGITDSGTRGLCGTMFKTEEQLVQILTSNEPEEDLAYFLNSNWSAKKGQSGGTRGRGKAMFLVASEAKKVFFDSLRSSDNEYVFGAIYLGSDKQVKFRLFFSEEAKREFQKVFGEKSKILGHVGTRVFIVEPNPTIIHAAKSGELLSYINHTWWEIIKKYKASITVNDGSGLTSASLLPWYENDSPTEAKKEYPPELVKDNSDYKTRRLVLRHISDQDIPESVQGIAIQRAGMVIQRISTDDLVHEEGIKQIYGWVEMDGTLETEMKNECEGPEHFSFSWNFNPARFLRNYLQVKIREFAKEFKVIESEQAKRNQVQKTAEEAAIKSLTALFKKLNLFGKQKGKRKKQSHLRGPNEPLRLSAPDIEFPGETRRVNFGEIIKGTYVIPTNETKEKISVVIRVFVVSHEGESKMIQEQEVVLSPGQGPKIGTESLKITNSFSKGGYSLRARMISLEDKNLKLSDGTKIEKGTIVYDRVNIKFYVETEPPESGPFHFEPKGREDREYLFEWEPDGDEGYIIFYNEQHPRISTLLQDENMLKDFLTQHGIMIALQIKLEELMAEDDGTEAQLTEVIKSKNPSRAWPVFLRRYSDFLWDLTYTKNGRQGKKK